MKNLLLILIYVFSLTNLKAQSPNFEWAKGIGGPLVSESTSFALDASGNIYTTGYFAGTVDFDPGVGVFNLTATSTFNTFILKLDATGNFVWVKQIGAHMGNSIINDQFGNIIVTGIFGGTIDFNPGNGIDTLNSLNWSTFILKLDSSGNYRWAKKLEGAGGVGISQINTNTIKSDKFGNIYTTGYFLGGSADFDPGIGVYNLTAQGNNDIFISKLDSLGNFVWAKMLGGDSTDLCFSMEIDDLGNVYTTGSFYSVCDFDPGIGVYNLTAQGNNDIFISKLDSLGNFVWAKNFGWNGLGCWGQGQSITLDSLGNIYTTGYFIGKTDFDPGIAVHEVWDTSGNTFILKLDSSGNFVWVKIIGKYAYSQGYSIALDSKGNVYTTGKYGGGMADFDPGLGYFPLISNGISCIFISKLNANGNFAWARSMCGSIGGTDEAVGLSIAVNQLAIYTTGTYKGTVDFDPVVGVFNLTSVNSNNNNFFVHKMAQWPDGLVENQSSNTTSIYPNPTDGIFYLSLTNPTRALSIEVYNSFGALIYKQNNVEKQNTINLNKREKGLYLVIVKNEGKVIASQKLLKE